jgi:hypothetical protein
MSNETPRYSVKMPNGVREWLDGTGVMQGSDEGERPCVKEELEGLKWNAKGASGEVSLYTLRWLADTVSTYLDFPDLSTSARKAAQAAAERYAAAYEEGRKAEAPKEPAGTTLSDGLVVPPFYGKPVYHVRDKGRIVGFLSVDGFAAIEDVREALGKLSGTNE